MKADEALGAWAEPRGIVHFSASDAGWWKDGYRFAQEQTKREHARLREALAFAASVIKSGEGWTATCEDKISGALRTCADSH